MGANILGFNDVVLLVVGDVSVDSGASVMTYQSRGLSVHSSNMLIWVGFAYLCSQVSVHVL